MRRSSRGFGLTDLLVSLAMLGVIGVIVLGVYKVNEGYTAPSDFEIVQTMEKMGYSRVVVKACFYPATISGCDGGNLFACRIRARDSRGSFVDLIACTPKERWDKDLSFVGW